MTGDDDHLHAGRRVRIPLHEIRLTFSTSGGPGGQHANKASTRVDLTWNVARSEALGPRQRARVLHKLSRRIDAEGDLHLSASDRRSQMRNREAVLERLGELVEEALRVPKARRATQPTKASRERRLERKRRHGETKRLRRTPGL